MSEDSLLETNSVRDIDEWKERRKENIKDVRIFASFQEE